MARKLVPTDTAEQLKLVWNRLTYALGGYFRAQFKIMGIVGIILFVGFLVMRIEYAVFLALIIAVLDFLPMLGTGTVMIPWALYLVLCGNLPLAAGLVILYAVTQVTRQLIQPKMVSDSIGIDTLTTLVFMFIGWRAAGLIGMIVAVPGRTDHPETFGGRSIRPYPEKHQRIERRYSYIEKRIRKEPVCKIVFADGL